MRRLLLITILLPQLVLLAQGYGFDRLRRDASSQHFGSDERPRRSISSNSPAQNDGLIGHGARHISPHGHDWLSDIDVSWLDSDKLEEVKEAGDSVAKVHKLRHFYDTLPSAVEKVEAAKKVVHKCYAWLPEVTSQQEREDLFALHHRDHNACKVKVEEFIERLSTAKQTQLRKYWNFCEHVWYDSHSADTTRGLSHDHGAHSTHYHPGQNSQTISSHPSHHQYQSPVQSPTPQAGRVRREMKTLEDYFSTHLSWLTDAQKEELRGMKAEGKSKKEIQQKIGEYYAATTGETKEKATQGLQGGCRELLRSVIGDEKADEIKQMKESGAAVPDIAKKVQEFLDAVTDDHKKALVGEYGPQCKKLFGVEAAPAPASRRRRDHHEGHGQHTLEDYFNTHLNWLTDAQKEDLRGMKTAGKSRSELQSKVFEFYDAATGETKEKATQQMQGGCRELLRSIIGDDKANEVKQMKESGTAVDELAKKVNEFIAEVTDEKKKQTVAEYGPACKRIFGVAAAASRRRRDHHEGHEAHHGQHTLEDYFKTHLNWLTDAQKEELRGLKTAGKSRSELQTKVFEYYEAATGETKEKATQQMQGGCRELLRSIIGDDKANEVKQMKESGTPIPDIAKKVQEYLDAVTDEHKKAVVSEYGPSCRKLFGVEAAAAPASRRRRDHHEGHGDATAGNVLEHTLEDHIKTHLGWLTDEQKEELRAMKANGKSKQEIQQKVLEYYDAATGETKEKATEQLQCGCRMLLRTVIGDDKADEIKQMKEAGSSMTELSAKVKEFISQVTDEGKKAVAEEYGPACRKLFGVDAQPAPSRMRRSRRYQEEADDNEVEPTDRQPRRGYTQPDPVDDDTATSDAEAQDSQDEFDTDHHYGWLNGDQKRQLRDHRTQGGSVHQKMLEFFDVSPDDVKSMARSLLSSGCEKLMSKIFGEEKAEEMKQMRSQGADAQEVRTKMQEFANEIEDEGERGEALQHGSICQKIFEATAVRRRRAPPLNAHLQQAETTGSIHDEETEEESPLRSQCRRVLFSLLGEDRVTELRERRSHGGSEQWLRNKVHFYLEEMRWESNGRLAEFTDECRRVFGIAPAGYGAEDAAAGAVQKKVGTPWAYVVAMDE